MISKNLGLQCFVLTLLSKFLKNWCDTTYLQLYATVHYTEIAWM